MKNFVAILGAFLALQVTAFNIPDFNRPGKCPASNAPEECPVDKTVSCLFDIDCPEQQKCCEVGCDALCVNSDGSFPTQRKDRKDCPPVENEGPCPDNSRAQCMSDSQCFGGDRCCYEGCTFKCLGTPIPSNPECSAPVDIGILIDTSGSLAQKDFNLEMKFVQNLISHFTLGENAARVSIGTIGSSPEVILHFHQGTSAMMVQAALNFVPYEQGKSELDAALFEAAEVMFKGDRKQVVKVLLVLTDGKTSSIAGLDMALMNLASKRVAVYAVGFSADINVMSLFQIASDENKIFAADKHASMLKSEGEVARMVCQQAEGLIPA